MKLRPNTSSPAQRRHPASAVCSDAFYELSRLRAPALETELLRGNAPALEALAGWEFRGMNTPSFARLLGIQKFIKGFCHPDAAETGSGAAALGYNVPVVQNSLYEPWIALPEDSRPKRFGFYQVAKPDPTARDNAYLHALLLDYSKAPAHRPMERVHPMRGLRDYLVEVRPDLLLGKAYYALGPARVGVSYFLLERHRQAP